VEKQLHGPLEGMPTHQIAVSHKIRIVDVTHVPVVPFHDVNFHRAALSSLKFPSAGGGSTSQELATNGIRLSA
jgi:hypothetical protein